MVRGVGYGGHDLLSAGYEDTFIYGKRLTILNMKHLTIKTDTRLDPEDPSAGAINIEGRKLFIKALNGVDIITNVNTNEMTAITIDGNGLTINKNLIAKGLTTLTDAKSNNLQTKSLSYAATPNDKFREVWGSVTLEGAKSSGSAGWTVTKTAKGTYTITLSPAFTETPTILVTSTAGINEKRIVSVYGIRTNNFIVNAYGLGGELQDTSFSFLVRGSA